MCEISTDAFVSNTQLSKLILGNNQIETLNPRQFHDLNNLTMLDLSSNNLKKLSQSLFTPCPNLTHLYLHNNQIGDLFANTFTNLTKLTHLYLHTNLISKIDSSNFMKRSTTNLRLVTLFNNQTSPNLLSLRVDQVSYGLYFDFENEKLFETNSLNCLNEFLAQFEQNKHTLLSPTASMRSQRPYLVSVDSVTSNSTSALSSISSTLQPISTSTTNSVANLSDSISQLSTISDKSKASDQVFIVDEPNLNGVRMKKNKLPI